MITTNTGFSMKAKNSINVRRALMAEQRACWRWALCASARKRMPIPCISDLPAVAGATLTIPAGIGIGADRPSASTTLRLRFTSCLAIPQTPPTRTDFWYSNPSFASIDLGGGGGGGYYQHSDGHYYSGGHWDGHHYSGGGRTFSGGHYHSGGGRGRH